MLYEAIQKKDSEGLMQPLCLIYQDISLQPFSPFPYRHPFEGILHLLAHLQAACEGEQDFFGG